MARIQKTVYDVVVATVADYGRMKKMLEKGNLPREQTAAFARRVAAIDNALLAVCDGESEEVRAALLRDIAYRRGYERSEAREYYPAVATLERRKREAVRMIGKMLGIV